MASGSHLVDKLEKWVSRIPGLRTYQEREHRRETDKRVREQLNSRLRLVLEELRVLERRIADSGALELLPELDRLCSSLQQLSDTILYAAYGYGGLLDLEKIREEQLARLYEFDLYLMDDVQAMEEEARCLASAAPGKEGFRRSLTELETRCRLLQERFERRRDYMTRVE
ncbi:MAG: hypothetical protein WHX93_06070 [bacterium]